MAVIRTSFERGDRGGSNEQKKKSIRAVLRYTWGLKKCEKNEVKNIKAAVCCVNGTSGSGCMAVCFAHHSKEENEAVRMVQKSAKITPK
jgi:hypothetical protein